MFNFPTKEKKEGDDELEETVWLVKSTQEFMESKKSG